ncbi:hypothetical protein BU24DRAFT_448361 [Aaosphaeria arxii CBS 175.79]|uniref:Uncharacterized protein n=1 Tax=Aaosphaeria arxii CBS 175.79 TaxID=1450172 RepID=A0A6A5Y564_9PLEO|nr:uncharacterized protein BU24DRAFT_448361 [Aaosphaeria arxii CBS 175.79]KAF2019991.1 hypothetical protein BU24DRAFT_448361 [Aaosphaeria arxii CBS 175.79]
MAFLRDVSTRFWEYVSPRKTQQRRDKDFKAKVSPLPQTARKQTERYAQWGSPKIKQERAILETPIHDSSMKPVNLPPSPPHSLDRRSYSDLEGDTLLDNCAGSPKSYKEEDGWDANEDTFVVDDDRYVPEETKDTEEERLRRDEQGQHLRSAGWTEDAIFLFQKLGMRGFEPLMPADWIDDFKSLPYDLFTNNLDKAFIKPALDRSGASADFHAFRALEELFQLGGRARDAIHQKAELRTPEILIRRAIRSYNKWALKDGGVDNLWGQLSLFEVVSASTTTSSVEIQSKMRNRLELLANRWHEAYRLAGLHKDPETPIKSSLDDCAPLPDIPTLYGIIASHTIMAFVSYDASVPQSGLRTVAIFDFGQEGYDVWNALAIAIFLIHCRNRLMDLKDYLPHPDELSSESDPDA